MLASLYQYSWYWARAYQYWTNQLATLEDCIPTGAFTKRVFPCDSDLTNGGIGLRKALPNGYPDNVDYVLLKKLHELEPNQKYVQDRGAATDFESWRQNESWVLASLTFTDKVKNLATEYNYTCCYPSGTRYCVESISTSGSFSGESGSN
jgi:hypothetical protein